MLHTRARCVTKYPVKSQTQKPPPKLVFDGLIKARVPKQVELDFMFAASRRGKTPTELAREVFNHFLAEEKKNANGSGHPQEVAA